MAANATFASLPIGPGDVKVKFPPGRPHFLPDIFVKENHPLVRPGSGKAYYYIQDGSPKEMAHVVRLEHNELEVPKGGENEALEKGFLKIVPGDTVFVRLRSSSPCGKDDVPVCWLTGPDLYSDTQVAHAVEVRDRMLGPREERSRDMPVRSGAGRIGGTRFERDFPPNGNVRGGRCYPYGTSFESFTKIYAPCAQSKATRATKDVMSYRSDLLEVTLDMATKSLMSGPDEVSAGLTLNHELLNLPSAGVGANSFFGANQLNLAPAEEYDSLSTLKTSLGSAGAAHIDPMDSPAHFTNMTCASDLPSNFDPGRFFILYPGVFYEQGNFVSFCFSGLRRHGGTPPVAPPGTSADELEWATRVTLVSYPPTGAVSFGQRRLLGIDSAGGPLYVTPEMIRPERHEIPEPTVDHASFVNEGPDVMKRSSLMKFMARSILHMALFVIRQLPSDIDARLDTDAFLGAFSYASEDGHRSVVGPWMDGPGWRQQNAEADSHSSVASSRDTASPVSQNDRVARKYEDWEAFYRKYAGHVPYAVAVKKKVHPLEGWTVGERLGKISSLKYPKKKKGANKSTGASKASTSSSALGASSSGSSSLTSLTMTSRSTVRSSKTATQSKKRKSTDVDDGVSQDDHELNSAGGSSLTRTSQRSSKRLRSHTTDRDGVGSSHLLNNSVLDTVLQESAGNCDSFVKDWVQDQNAIWDDLYDTIWGPSEPIAAPEFLDQVNTVKDSCSAGDVAMETSMSESASTADATPRDGCSTQNNLLDSSVVPTAASPLTVDATRRDGCSTQNNSDGSSIIPVATPPSPKVPKKYLMETQLPSGLTKITAEDVYSDLSAVQTSVLHIWSKSGERAQNATAETLMLNVRQAVRNSPLDISTFGVMQATQQGLYRLLADEREDVLRSKHFRALLMTINYQVWKWLEDEIPYHVLGMVMDLRPTDCPWLRQLVLDATKHLALRSEAFTFVPSAYGVIGLPSSTINIDQYGFDAIGAPVSNCSVVEIVHDVLCDWLSRPPRDVPYWGAVYVEVLLAVVGQDALYLDCVWKMHKRASSQTTGERSKVPIAVRYGDSTSPLLEPSSEIRRNIQELAGLVRACVGNEANIFDPSQVCPSSSGQPSAPLPDSIVSRRESAFKKFVSDCYSFHFFGMSTSNTELDKLLAKESDRYLPFREHAATRKNLKKQGGPFSPEHIRTVEGLFSALVGRATTFDTKFSREGRTLFRSPADFFAATNELGCTKESEYCNPVAYGQPDVGKKPDLVHQYWTTIKNDIPWPCLSATKPVPFLDCCYYFYPAHGKPRFPHLGRLGAYLLTSDYVYAGVVKRPSLDDIAEIVRKINKGPIAAFEFLNWSTPRTQGSHGTRHLSADTDIGGLIKRAYNLMQECLPSESHKEVGLDYIVTEHTLCKFSRVTGGVKPVVRVL